MGGTTEKTTNTTQNTSTSFPEWTQPAGQSIFDNAASWLSSNPTMPTYSGKTVADFGSGFGQANDWASSFLGGDGLSDQQKGSSDALTKIMGSIDPSKGVESYMDPYVDATLQPTIRHINESLAGANATTSAGAAAAGALGDTGWGGLMAQNQRNAGQAISDATAGAYDRAFTNAQGARNTALSQLMQAASGNASLGQQGIGNNSSMAQFLASLGGAQQQAGQKGLDTAHSDFLQGLNYPIKQGIGLSSILQSIPKNTTGFSNGQSTSSSEDNSALGAVGGIFGKLLFA